MAIFAGDHRRGRPSDKMRDFEENITFSKLLVRQLWPSCVQVGEEGWVNLIKSEFDLLVFLKTCFLKHHGHLRSLEKVMSRRQLLLGFKKKY